MVIGEWTKDKVTAMKYLPMEVSMKGSMFRIKCKVRESMSGLMARSTKESGTTT